MTEITFLISHSPSHDVSNRNQVHKIFSRNFLCFESGDTDDLLGLKNKHTEETGKNREAFLIFFLFQIKLMRPKFLAPK